MESQPQNTEFRIDSENIHHYVYHIQLYKPQNVGTDLDHKTVLHTKYIMHRGNRLQKLKNTFPHIAVRHLTTCGYMVQSTIYIVVGKIPLISLI